MNFLRQAVERKLTGLLGLPVSIEKLDVAVFKGAATARGVVIGQDSRDALLRVDAIRFDIAVGKALQKEFQVKSLTIDRPTLTLVRRADGTWNLPKTTPRDASVDDAAEAGQWKFDLSKLLLIDGTINLQIYLDESTVYQVSATSVLGEITHGGMELKMTLMTTAVRCAGNVSPAGELKVAAKLWPCADFRTLTSGALQATLELGDYLRLTVTSEKIEDRSFGVLLDSAMELSELLALLPPIKALNMLRSMQIHGPLRLSTDIHFTAPQAKA